MGVQVLDKVRHCIPKEGETWGPALSYLPGEGVTGRMGILGRGFETPLFFDRGLAALPFPKNRSNDADGGTWHKLPARPSIIRHPRRWRLLSGGGPEQPKLCPW